MLFLVFYIFAFGLVPAAIFKSKGRSPIVGFFMGMIVNILGTPIALLLSSKKEGPNRLLDRSLEIWNKYIFLNHKTGGAQGFAGLGIMISAFGIYAIISGQGAIGDGWMALPIGIVAIMWSFISENLNKNRESS